MTFSGTATNETPAQVDIEGATAQLLDSSGAVLTTGELTPGGFATYRTLDSGQTVALSGGPLVTVDTLARPVLGAVSLDWDWAASSRYATCPGSNS